MPPTGNAYAVNARPPLCTPLSPSLARISALLRDTALRRQAFERAMLLVSPELAPNFSPLHYVRVDEVALSSIFADLLNPLGSHGQRESYLRLFLDHLGLSDVPTPARVEVHTEFELANRRRIDVLLECPNFVIAIENKPWASDQEKQLLDYSTHVERRASGLRPWRLVYLCNHEPTERSIPPERRADLLRRGNLIETTYQWVTSWLDECAKTTKALQVRVFLAELRKYIHTEINGQMRMNEASEISDLILQTTDNIEAAIAIERSVTRMKASLLKELQRSVDEQLKGLSMPIKANWDEGIFEWFKAYSGFGFKLSEDQHIYLRFEFDRTNLVGFFWGLARTDISVPNERVRWERIADIMANRFGAAHSSPWWPWYSEIPDNHFDASFSNWTESGAPWREIHTGLMAKRLACLAESVYRAFSENENEWLLRPDWKGQLS